MRFLGNYSSTASTSYFDSSTESMCIQKSTQQKVPKRLSGHHCITDCPDKQNSPSDPFLLFPPRPLQTLIFPPPPPPRRWVGRGLFLFFVFLLSDDFQPYCRSLNFSKEDEIERASFLPLSPLHLPTYVSRLFSSAPGFISHTHSLVLSERRPSSPSSFFFLKQVPGVLPRRRRRRRRPPLLLLLHFLTQLRTRSTFVSLSFERRIASGVGEGEKDKKGPFPHSAILLFSLLLPSPSSHSPSRLLPEKEPFFHSRAAACFRVHLSNHPLLSPSAY